MATVRVSPETNSKRETFFKLVFGKSSGYVCIGHMPERGDLHENFFYYPDELPEMLEHVNRIFADGDVYFCPQLLSSKRRLKDNVLPCPTLWADLDECNPKRVSVEPSVVIESSPQRWQALWILDEPIEAEIAEDLSRRIAYFYADEGADKSGWDLTQLLRVPLTYNRKYEQDEVVLVVEANQRRYRPDDFEIYPQPEAFGYLEIPFPDDLPDIEATEILRYHQSKLNPTAWTLFYEEPQEDWSKKLWQLELTLLESGLSREEAFMVCEAAACNKYRRDGKPRQLLWKEVCKAEAKISEREKQLAFIPRRDPPKLLTEAEVESCKANPTFIEDYVEWAKTLGDAAWQYHQAGAFTILSSLLASAVQLPTSYGVVKPNLWFLILADTTLTRKTTAMDLAMDLVLEIDQDAVLATDGSIEGLMTTLSMRPGRASIFLRDEFSGLIEMMTKRDYYAGMAEALTKLYDGKFQKRVLRREVIEVKDPVLIIFAGGIKTRMYELLNYTHVSSGFIPRFIFIAAESDITRLKPLGPPTDRTRAKRDELLKRCTQLYEHFHRIEVVKVGDKEITTTKKWDASLTDEAWVRYNKFEADLVAWALDSERPDLMTPTMDRLSKSGLKMAVLLAATRGGTEVVVTEEDLVRAFYYLEQWVVYTIDVQTNIGKTTSERLLERILASIRRTPGISRSQVMQNNHLTARDAELVFTTLEQRGMVQRHKKGKGEYFTPVAVT